MNAAMAAVGFDPAWAAPLNLLLLVVALNFAITFVREVKWLRSMVVKQAEESARIAKGSETRAENAAAEITRLVAKVESMVDGRRDASGRV